MIDLHFGHVLRLSCGVRWYCLRHGPEKPIQVSEVALTFAAPTPDRGYTILDLDEETGAI